jgi:ABC-2 type transport system permease protein
VRGHLFRAYPTLFRVGFAAMVAYRTEFIIWVLTTNLPLIMMGLWTAVAAEGPVGRFESRDFVAYYLGMLAVRILTGSWLVWELTMDIRQGTLATRLLRPLHPLWAYSAEHLSAVPLRALVVSPLFVILVIVARDRIPFHDPVRLLILLLSFAGAWLILFFTMALIGLLALWVESALSVYDLWLGVHAILSGYLVPLELLPPWIASAAQGLPFRYMLGFPVELLIGMLDRRAAFEGLAIQWLYVLGLLGATLLFWRTGTRKFVAFGG